MPRTGLRSYGAKEREILEKTGGQILWIHGEEAHSGSHSVVTPLPRARRRGVDRQRLPSAHGSGSLKRVEDARVRSHPAQGGLGEPTPSPGSPLRDEGHIPPTTTTATTSRRSRGFEDGTLADVLFGHRAGRHPQLAGGLCQQPPHAVQCIQHGHADHNPVEANFKTSTGGEDRHKQVGLPARRVGSLAITGNSLLPHHCLREPAERQPRRPTRSPRSTALRFRPARSTVTVRTYGVGALMRARWVCTRVAGGLAAVAVTKPVDHATPSPRSTTMAASPSGRLCDGNGGQAGPCVSPSTASFRTIAGAVVGRRILL